MSQIMDRTLDADPLFLPLAAPLPFRALSRWHLIFGAQILDIAAILSVAVLVYPASGANLAAIPARYLLGALAAALICHFSFAQGRLYDIEALTEETRTIKSIAVRWSVVFLGLAALGALAHRPDLYSRMWVLSFFAGGFASLAAGRVVIAMFIRRAIGRGFTTKSVVVVGDNALAAGLIAKLNESQRGIRVIGVFDDSGPGRYGEVLSVPRRGGIDDLLELTSWNMPDFVVLTLPISDAARIKSVISRLRHQPLNIRLLPGAIGLDPVSPIRLSRAELPGVQLIAVADRPISELALFVKGAFDRTVAALGLLLLLPVLLLCAAGIAWTSPGPVLFRQPRIGYRGRVFQIYKFRTMSVTGHPHIRLTQRDDPRVFKFGSLLRKVSLDELPQLLNVVKGEMSLVGPRPHMPEARAAGKLYFEAVNEYAARHRVRPGITGWAQVSGWRGPTDTVEQIERRVEHDIYYIENWSLMLDFAILVKTVFVGFFGKNAF